MVVGLPVVGTRHRADFDEGLLEEHRGVEVEVLAQEPLPPEVREETALGLAGLGLGLG